jgi:glutathione synthase
MRILFIADPLSGFNIAKDSTYVMMKAAVARGHTLAFCEPAALFAESGRVWGDVSAVTLAATETQNHWYDLGEATCVALTDFDAVVMRKDPPFDLAYLYSTQLLSLAQSHGARVFNDGAALRDWNEKLAILNYPELTSPTLVSSQDAPLRRFAALHGDVIVKPLDGMGGEGIFRLQAGDVNFNAILETATVHNTRTVMMQKFIPDIVNGDKRVLVIGGVPVEYCVARIPKAGETRGNLAAGGTAEVRPLSDSDRALALKVAPALIEKGVLLAGLDVIGSQLTEINITSPTCFQEIMKATGLDVAELFVVALEKACGVV